MQGVLTQLSTTGLQTPVARDLIKSARWNIERLEGKLAMLEMAISELERSNA